MASSWSNQPGRRERIFVDGQEVGSLAEANPSTIVEAASGGNQIGKVNTYQNPDFTEEGRQEKAKLARSKADLAMAVHSTRVTLNGGKDTTPKGIIDEIYSDYASNRIYHRGGN